MIETTTHIKTNKQLVPALRFKEFDDLWKKSTIEDHFEFKNGLNKEKEFFGYGTPIINFKDVYNLEGIKLNDIKGLVKLSENEIKRYDALKGDVFFTRTSETIFDIGMAAALVEDIPNCVFSGFVLRARPIDNALVDDYKKFCFGTWSVRKEIVTKSSFTTRALTSGTLLNKVAFHFPKSHNEQQKIASFLSAVDDKVQQLTKKKELLEQYKKGVMQQLFSGQLRFKDQNGNPYPDWEEKRLGGLCSTTTGKLDANAMREDGEYRFYTCAREYYQIDKYAFDTEALLVSGNGANVGYIHYYKGKFNAYQRTYVLDEFEQNIFYIKKYLEKNLYKRIHVEKKDGNTPYITLSTLTEMKVDLPSLPEQQKIATCLSSIDTKIEAVNNQITQTQTFKKGLLQQLFI
jgi:type I restriction enzyme S subunit